MGIDNVSGWFCRILGPLNSRLGLRTPVESYMRATEVAFKVGDEALFPTSTHAQKMPARPTYSLLGSPSWFTRSVLRSQGRENILAASSSKQQQAAASSSKQQQANN